MRHVMPTGIIAFFSCESEFEFDRSWRNIVKGKKAGFEIRELIYAVKESKSGKGPPSIYLYRISL